MVPTSVDIDPNTVVMGLIGESIGYSLSPLIHNISAKALGINAAYFCFSLDTREVEGFLDAMWAVGALGFNITQPHKELVAHLIGHSDLMSINTLYRGKDGWLAESTDGIGLHNALLHDKIELLDFGRIIILGSGGAALSVAEYLQRRAFRGEVVLAIRSRMDTVKLRRLENLRLILVHQRSDLLAKLITDDASTLLIQATSAPLKSDPMQWLIPALQRFSGVYFDMTYSADSAPLKYCRHRGLKAFDGIGMLIEQARASQKLWWGKCEDFDSIARRLEARST